MAKQEDGWSREVEVDGSKTIQGVPMCHDVRRGNQESWTGLDKSREYSGYCYQGLAILILRLEAFVTILIEKR